MASLSLVLCDDAHIRALNNRYRGKDYATDVLSFELKDSLDFKASMLDDALGIRFCISVCGTAARMCFARRQRFVLPVRYFNFMDLWYMCITCVRAMPVCVPVCVCRCTCP